MAFKRVVYRARVGVSPSKISRDVGRPIEEDHAVLVRDDGGTLPSPRAVPHNLNRLVSVGWRMDTKRKQKDDPIPILPALKNESVKYVANRGLRDSNPGRGQTLGDTCSNK